MKKETNLFILNLTLTLRCTLKCKLCVADVTKYENPPHFDLAYLCNSIDRCFEFIDHAERFQLSGGEPLMHKDIHLIVEKAMQYKDKFGMLGFFSNGTIVPSNELIQTINKYKNDTFIKFYLSHYGDCSTKMDEIIEQLKANNIAYDVKKYYGNEQHFDGWVDYGNYEYHNYSEKEVDDLFKNCGVHQMGGIWSMRFGEIHRCTRSASGMSLGKIPKNREDYIDLFNEKTSDERRNELLKLMEKKHIDACKYCAGDFGTVDKSKRYPAAEQL